MYVSFLTFVLGYGQLLALAQLSSIITARCELVFVTAILYCWAK